eukprot:1169601-Pyramimonas_sp.AAC.1
MHTQGQSLRASRGAHNLVSTLHAGAGGDMPPKKHKTDADKKAAAKKRRADPKTREHENELQRLRTPRAGPACID